MNVKIFTLKFNKLSGSFDDVEVRQFLADKEVQSIQDHAFAYQGMPYLTLIIVYNHIGGNEHPVLTGKNHANERDENWRKVLQETDIPLFNTLREWRSHKAREEGVPTYFVCTNKQLADIAHTRPTSMTALAKVDGFGQGRLKKYGQEILAILSKKVGTELSAEEEKIMPPFESPNNESI
ncbi:MAG: HRDC domain-containing protein [Magnetococcales bacterium]|nr:HRDC domain-containing protein [Magnetococcales bacterium]